MFYFFFGTCYNRATNEERGRKASGIFENIAHHFPPYHIAGGPVAKAIGSLAFS